MKVLIVGNKGGAGGREHAFGVALAASSQVDQVFFAPGNGGTTAVGTNLDITQEQAADWAKQNNIDLVVIGPEAPIVEGIADQFRGKGLKVCGPSKSAAQLEGSKAFAFEFMDKHSIPQPPSQVIANEEEGLATISALGGPENVVIKADGLAAGKGVFLPDSEDEAKQALEKIFAGGVDGSGDKVVIQQRYHGNEVSVFVLSDGQTHYIIPVAAQDHKRAFEGDEGPNTGGMGAYAPVPENVLSSSQWQKVREIAEQTIKGMKEDGDPYQGILYMGLILAEELNSDPAIIEYNVRFGDPEAQVLLPLLTQAGVDMYDLLSATAEPGKLSGIKLPEKLDEAAMTVVLASKGYPVNPQTGQEIIGLDKNYPNALVYHFGTKQDESGKLVSAGGRVLNITGFGKTLAEAKQAAYAAIGDNGIHFDGMHYRRDIGWRALK